MIGIRTIAALIWATTLTAAATEKPPLAPPADDPVAIVHAFVSALSNADLDGLLDTFTEDATVFMPAVDQARVARLAGKAAIREGFRPFFETLRESDKGPPYMVLTPHDLTVQNLGATAIVTFHLGPLPEEPIDRPLSFSRRTFVVNRTDGGWRIVHLHASNVVIEASASSDRK